MSISKNIKESERWLNTALEDWSVAELLLNGKKYAHSCFNSQQAAEKSVKALYFFLDAEVWGHSVKKLISGLVAVDCKYYEIFKALENDAAILDRFYIPTRYPDGLPDLTPSEAYIREDAESALVKSRNIIDKIKKIISESKS